MPFRRTLLKQFSLANSAYIGSTVTFYAVDPTTKERLTTLVTLYSDLTGSGQVPNPYTLDSNGKFLNPVYHDEPLIAVIDESELPSHETGVVVPNSNGWRGDWEAGQLYLPSELVRDGINSNNSGNLYTVANEHESTVFNTDVSAGNLEIALSYPTVNLVTGVSGILPLAHGGLESDTAAGGRSTLGIAGLYNNIGVASATPSTAPAAVGTDSLAIGSGSKTAASEAIAIGVARAGGAASFAACIGDNTSSYGTTALYSMAIGRLAKATGSYSLAFGGELNLASGSWSCCIGGTLNQAASTYAAALGGANNIIAGTYAGGLGGTGNNATGSASACAGGGGNTTSANYSASLGGANCTVSGTYSASMGGFGNIVSALEAAAVGGDTNEVSGARAACVGGTSNVISSQNGAQVGGLLNTVSTGASAAGVGGSQNTVTGAAAFNGGGVGNTASGSNSSTVGGLQNGATGDYSNVSGGYGNVASAPYSQAGGRAAVASLYGERAWMADGFSGTADAMRREVILRGITTNNSQSEIFLDGGSLRMVIPTECSWTATIIITARRTDAANESASYKIECGIDNNSGTVALVAAITKTVIAEDTAAWDVTAEADNTNDALVIKVTGENAKTIRWVADVRIVQVKN